MSLPPRGRAFYCARPRHYRWELWRAASVNPGTSGRAASEPAVVVLDLPSREDAMLFLINSQMGRRNIADVDRIM